MPKPKPSRQFRVLAIYKKSAFELFIKERKHPRMMQLFKMRHPQLVQLHDAHQIHKKAVHDAKVILKRLGADAIFRYRADTSSVRDVDLVITLGGDGTLLSGSHLVGQTTPILAINTVPKVSVGFFCAGTIRELEALVDATMRGQLAITPLARMRIDMDHQLVSNRILNDTLFAHRHPSSMTRYQIKYQGRSEDQRSSGVWMGPAAGSTAALRSAGGSILPIRSQSIQFVVRELYRPATLNNRPQPPIRKGLIQPSGALRIINQTRDAQLFLDGSQRRVQVAMGAELIVRASEEPLSLLGFRRGKW